MYSEEVPEELRRVVQGAFPGGVDSNVLLDIWRHFSDSLPPQAALSHETAKASLICAFRASVPGAGTSAPPALPTFTLRWTHECKALARRKPGCLCNNDALPECDSPFDDKYIMSWSELHCLRAPCGAKICVTVTQDGVGEGGAAWDAFKQSFPGATLQMCLLPGGHFQTQITERGAMDWTTAGALGTLLTDRDPRNKHHDNTSTSTTPTATQDAPTLWRPVLMRHDGLPESSDGFVSFQPGKGSQCRPMPDVSFRASGEILAKVPGCALGKKMPPLDLVIRAVDARGCPLDSLVRPAVSERPRTPQGRPIGSEKGTFAVVTDRSKSAVKAKVPEVNMDVMKIIHIGEKVRNRLNAKGVKTVGELLELLDGVKASPSHSEALRKELCMEKVKWEAMKQHVGEAVQPDCPVCCKGTEFAWPSERPEFALPTNFAPEHDGAAAMFHSSEALTDDPLMAIALDAKEDFAGVAWAGPSTQALRSGPDAAGGKDAQDASPTLDAAFHELAPVTPSPAGHTFATGLCGSPQNWGLMESSPFGRELKRLRTAPESRAPGAHPDASPTGEYVNDHDFGAANQENGAPAVNIQTAEDGRPLQAPGGALMDGHWLDSSMEEDGAAKLAQWLYSDC